jgi:uncharacterized protein YegP (UPF0339 family)
MGAFVISQRVSGLYKFEYASRRGKTIITSNDFELRFECEEQIEYLKRAIERIVFMKFKSGNGKFFFRMVLDEKQIAVSRKYTTQLLLQKGIEELLQSLSMSEVLDFSTDKVIFPEINWE